MESSILVPYKWFAQSDRRGIASPRGYRTLRSDESRHIMRTIASAYSRNHERDRNRPEPEGTGAVQELAEDQFDYVISLGERAISQCRDFGSAELIHWKFDDLVTLSDDPEKQLRAFRMVRDQIAQRFNLFVLVLAGLPPSELLYLQLRPPGKSR